MWKPIKKTGKKWVKNAVEKENDQKCQQKLDLENDMFAISIMDDLGLTLIYTRLKCEQVYSSETNMSGIMSTQEKWLGEK